MVVSRLNKAQDIIFMNTFNFKQFYSVKPNFIKCLAGGGGVKA